ncbi:MAG: hypothetical protein Q9185_006489 [Variospora sp. 1 TL-2023]
MDLLPTLVDLVGGSFDHRLPLDGVSLLPYMKSQLALIPHHDTVFGEYAGEGTIAPLMMIRRGPWKFVTCPADPPQLFNLKEDPKELHNLAVSHESSVAKVFKEFDEEANTRWNFQAIHDEVLKSQRSRRLCWAALSQGRYQSMDYQPNDDDASKKYIRSNVPLDELELRARYPPVDALGRELRRGQAEDNAGAKNE